MLPVQRLARALIGESERRCRLAGGCWDCTPLSGQVSRYAIDLHPIALFGHVTLEMLSHRLRQSRKLSIWDLERYIRLSQLSRC